LSLLNAKPLVPPNGAQEREQACPSVEPMVWNEESGDLMKRSSRRMPTFGLFVTATLLFQSSLVATTVLPLNIEELISRADRAFRGICLSVEEITEQGNRQATLYGFSVLESMKGNLGKQVTIKVSGWSQGGRGERRSIPGMPTFEPGEEVLLFLTRPNDNGFSAPVGLYLGVFRLQPDPTGGQQAVNGIDNMGLLTGLDAGQLEQAGVSPEEFPWLAQDKGPVPLDGFLRVVERLIQNAAR